MSGAMPHSVIPASGSAQVHVLHEGYAREGDGGERVAGTVTLITDGDSAIVVDPGMVASRAGLLSSLAARGVAPEGVTDVVFSHHHPDHTVNAALFPAARIHDHWAIYDGDLWVSRDAEGYHLSPSVLLLATPGHTAQDITTVAAAPGEVYACTHAWWGPGGPTEDPLAEDPAALSSSRARIIEIASVIIPGHGAAFRPGPSTPR
jgi:glyoxylase-like metal-dependent hydrolase (beta-lactamase superfamily II)